MNRIRINRKFSWFKIQNILFWVAIGTFLCYVSNFILATQGNSVVLSDRLYFNFNLIKRGEFWRLITFIFVPMSKRMLVVALDLLMLIFVGRKIEMAIGSLKFSMFYLAEIAGCIFAGILTNVATIFFVNLIIFLIYAEKYANHKVNLMFIIPTEVRWIGFIVLIIYFCYMISALFLWDVHSIVESVVVLTIYLLFFSPRFILDLFKKLKQFSKNAKPRSQYYY